MPLWNELESMLQYLHPAYLTNYERAFGLPGSTPNIILRNWLTFLLRQCIVEQERIAYHNKKGNTNVTDIKVEFNQAVKRQVWLKYNILQNLGKLQEFETTFAVNNFLIAFQNEQWEIVTMFKIN